MLTNIDEHTFVFVALPALTHCGEQTAVAQKEMQIEEQLWPKIWKALLQTTSNLILYSFGSKILNILNTKTCNVYLPDKGIYWSNFHLFSSPSLVIDDQFMFEGDEPEPNVHLEVQFGQQILEFEGLSYISSLHSSE